MQHVALSETEAALTAIATNDEECCCICYEPLASEPELLDLNFTGVGSCSDPGGCTGEQHCEQLSSAAAQLPTATIVLPACGHKIHDQCLDSWLQHKSSEFPAAWTCPLCRMEIDYSVRPHLELPQTYESYGRKHLEAWRVYMAGRRKMRASFCVAFLALLCLVAIVARKYLAPSSTPLSDAPAVPPEGSTRVMFVIPTGGAPSPIPLPAAAAHFLSSISSFNATA